MFITVLICTRNRASGLPGTLECILRPQNLAASDWEIIVVDNGSSDDTSRVCREFQAAFPTHLRCLFEAKTGKSNALNTGIAVARGDVLAMTDDDALPAPDYLPAVRRVFAQHAVDAAQGRVLLDCEGGLPQWVDREMAYLLASRDYGDQVLDWKKDLVGVNMIVRAEVFRKVGGFRPDLGPGAAGLNEDSEFSVRVHQAGFRVIYAPQIVVRHQLPRARLTKSYMRSRYFVVGRCLAFYNPLPTPIWRYSLYVAKELAFREGSAIWHLLAGRPAVGLHGECNARLQAGFLLEHWRLRRQEVRPKPPAPASSTGQ
jgi:glycosyltransferase involved in cell wall biosynthesis